MRNTPNCGSTELTTGFFTFQTVIWASLSLFVESGLLIWTRPMSPKELAISLLLGFGAFIVFGVAVIAQFIDPTLAEIRLRLRHMELHYQANAMEADIVQLRTAMRQLISHPSGHAGGTRPAPPAIEDPYIIPDPDEPSADLPVGVNRRSLST